MTFNRIPAAIAALGLVAGAAIAAPAMAEGEAPALRLAQAGAYSDDKLQSFATAALDVERLRERFTAEFAGAETEEERGQIAQRANDQMLEVVEGAPDITVQEYNEIATAAQQDPALAARIEEYLLAMQQ